jgi:putative intracellular protease/amidase
MTVGILLFDGVEIIDYSGPWEVFGEAGFGVHTVARTNGPVTTVFGQKVIPEYTLANSPVWDILLIPGGNVPEELLADTTFIGWISRSAKDAHYVMSVCTGAFIASKAGLLDGLSATTFHSAIEQLAKFAPGTRVVHDKRFVDNGKIITTAGLSSGIDGALHLVSKVLGKGRTQQIALNLEYRWDPDSRYARANLADRYLPDFKGFEAAVVSTEGDTEHWELRALVSRPGSPAEITALTASELVSGTPHAGSKVTVRQGGTNVRSTIEWQFTDERGRDWQGEGVVIPSAEEEGRFLSSLTLACRKK